MKTLERIEVEIVAVENALNKPQAWSEYGRNYWRSNLRTLKMIHNHFDEINPESATFEGAVAALDWCMKELS
jgi:hypothetical protein